MPQKSALVRHIITNSSIGDGELLRSLAELSAGCLDRDIETRYTSHDICQDSIKKAEYSDAIINVMNMHYCRDIEMIKSAMLTL